MRAAGYEPRPVVLEREFTTRYWGKSMALHGVRRWLRGETFPAQEKLLVLAEWLAVPPQQLRFGSEVTQRVQQRRARWASGVGYEDRDIFEALLRLPVSLNRWREPERNPPAPFTPGSAAGAHHESQAQSQPLAALPQLAY